MMTKSRKTFRVWYESAGPTAAGKGRQPFVAIHDRVVGLADGADHGDAGGAFPFLRHALAGVAAPAFDQSLRGEDAAVDAAEFVFVQPRLRGAVDLVAVIEHESRFVAVQEPVEAGDFDRIAGLSGVEVVDHGIRRAEPNEFDPVFRCDTGNPTGEGTFILTETPLVARTVDQPSDARVGIGCADLLETRHGRADKIAPPAVMRRVLEFLPLVKRDAAADYDVFRLVGRMQWSGGNQQESYGDEAWH